MEIGRIYTSRDTGIVLVMMDGTLMRQREFSIAFELFRVWRKLNMHLSTSIDRVLDHRRAWK